MWCLIRWIRSLRRWGRKDFFFEKKKQKTFGPLRALWDRYGPRKCFLMFSFTRRLTIEWGDCDPAGIVYYPRYFAMFDASTAALFAAALGYNKFEMLRRHGIIGMPMVDTGAKFFSPSRYGDEVAIESRIAFVKRSSFGVVHRLRRADGVTAIEAHETRVWAAKNPEREGEIFGQAVPAEVREKLGAES